MSRPRGELSWCEVSTSRLAGNLSRFRELVGPDVLLAPAVKANAYGHGLELASRAFLDGGADWLCVNALQEARALRAAGIDAPIYILGAVAPEGLAEALALECRLVLFDPALPARLAELASPDRPARVHLKIETGTQRQGLRPDEALATARDVQARPEVELEGLTMHFANVEDTTDHAFARAQLAAFEAFAGQLTGLGIPLPALRHCTNTAATLLWPHAWYELARLGIGAYGMWPSGETRVSAALAGREDAVRLEPALTWKTLVVQVKDVPAGEFVGYGLTYRCTHPSRLAILPVGYHDGYDRRLSNAAHVLVRGQRAPVRGRVCMNITIVDVTHIEGAAIGDEAVLLGPQGGEAIAAEQLADWIGTINYEVTTRINPQLPRVAVP